MKRPTIAELVRQQLSDGRVESMDVLRGVLRSIGLGGPGLDVLTDGELAKIISVGRAVQTALARERRRACQEKSCSE